MEACETLNPQCQTLNLNHRYADWYLAGSDIPSKGLGLMNTRVHAGLRNMETGNQPKLP